MAITESSRFHASLKKAGAPVTRLIVNQVLPPSASEGRFYAVKQKVWELLTTDRTSYVISMIQGASILAQTYISQSFFSSMAES